MARRPPEPRPPVRLVTVLFVADGVIHDYPDPPKTLFTKGQIVELRSASAQFWILRDVATDDAELITEARAKAGAPAEEPAVEKSEQQPE